MERILRIREEAVDFAHNFNVPFFLDRNCNWLIVYDFRLPPGFQPTQTMVLLRLDYYPEIPPGISPNDVYLAYDLKFNGKSPKYYHYNQCALSYKGWHNRCFLEISWNNKTDTLTTFFKVLTIALQEESDE